MDEQYLIRDIEIPCVYHDSNFISKSDADDYYETLRTTIPWQKTAKINRWVRLYQAVDDVDESTIETTTSDGDEDGSDEGTSGYTYKDAPPVEDDKNKDNNVIGAGYPELIQSIRQQCQDWYAAANPHCKQDDNIPSFNICLLNFYEDGQQRIGWHSDREEIGRTTPIISVSLGASRQFLLRSQTDGRNDRCSLNLTSGSVTVMEPICQIKYLHSVPKESDVVNGRINLTFRCK
ncbi:hypothetical protein FRACYDRAFT_152506, partial [Fragilariopsis cylindrus CCMP1102]